MPPFTFFLARRAIFLSIVRGVRLPNATAFQKFSFSAQNRSVIRLLRYCSPARRQTRCHSPANLFAVEHEMKLSIWQFFHRDCSTASKARDPKPFQCRPILTFRNGAFKNRHNGYRINPRLEQQDGSRPERMANPRQRPSFERSINLKPQVVV
jgi:hypothetical protein